MLSFSISNLNYSYFTSITIFTRPKSMISLNTRYFAIEIAVSSILKVLCNAYCLKKMGHLRNYFQRMVYLTAVRHQSQILKSFFISLLEIAIIKVLIINLIPWTRLISNVGELEMKIWKSFSYLKFICLFKLPTLNKT